MNNPVQQFQDAMKTNGFNPPEITADGKPHRFDIDKSGDHKGYYQLFTDGVPFGLYGSWSEQEPGGWLKWSAKSENKMTESERAENRRRWKQTQAEQAKELAEDHSKAAAEAKRVWNSSTPASDDHPYLTRKQVKAHGIRQQGDDLIIPVRINGKLTSIQRIKSDGSKRFLTDGAISGGYHSIAGNDPADMSRVYIAEGLATGATIREATSSHVAVAFNAGNLGKVAQSIRTKLPDAEIIIAGDNDESTIGETKGKAAADAVGGKLVLPTFSDGESGTDWNDFSSIHGLDTVRNEIESQLQVVQNPETCVDVKAESQADTVRRLAELSPLEYDRVRAPEAKTLGVRASTLDAEVKAARKEAHSDDDIFPEVEPWPEAVDGCALLDEIASTFRRYVILPKHADTVAALWVLNTYVHDASYHSPMIILTSPEKRCGKTTAMMVFMAVCSHPLPASNVSGAVVFRAIDKWHPTLMIDEVDSFLADKEDLRGIINSGHTKAGAFVLRCFGDEHEPKRFSTWCPKILSGIGRISDTLEDRSILFPLRRKLPDENVARLRIDRGGFDEIKQKCIRWGEDSYSKVAARDPVTPSGLNDRAADNWTPLFAIADLCDWREKAELAALNLSGDTDNSDSPNVMLLEDVRKVFGARGVDRLPSQSICDDLAKMEDRPWPEWYKGRPITPRQIAKRLGGFGIHPGTIRVPTGGTIKGYELQKFTDSFTRYLSKGNTVTTQGTQQKQDFSKRNMQQGVTDRNSQNLKQNNGCDVVTDRKPPADDEPDFGDDLPPVKHVSGGLLI